MSLRDDIEKAALAPHYKDLAERFDEAASAIQARWAVTVLAPFITIGPSLANKDMARDLEDILGVTHVICVAESDAEHDQKIVLEKTDMQLFVAYFPPSHVAPPDEMDIVAVWRYIQTQIDDSLRKQQQFPRFYVHCQEGKHRAPAMAAVILAALTNTSFDHWLKRVCSLRPLNDVHARPEMLEAMACALAIIQGREEDGDGDFDGDGGAAGDPDHDAGDEAKEIDLADADWSGFRVGKDQKEKRYKRR